MNALHVILLSLCGTFEQNCYSFLWFSTGDDYLDLGSDCEKYSSLHCHSGGCIEKHRVCDFHTDCPHGEDEGLICSE